MSEDTECPECHATVPESLTYCPNCGTFPQRPLSQSQPQKADGGATGSETVPGRHSEAQPEHARATGHAEASGHAEATGHAEAIEQRTTTATSRSAIVPGFLGGLFAFVSGFVLTIAFTDSREELEQARELISSSGDAGQIATRILPEPYKLFAWEFLENHQVGVTVEFADELGSPDWARNAIELFLPSSSKLQIVPPLLLLLAGFAVALWTGKRQLRDAAKAGLFVALGYLPAITLLTSVSSFEAGASISVIDITVVTIEPQFAKAVLVAGMLYPLAFGALGGALASRLRPHLPDSIT